MKISCKFKGYTASKVYREGILKNIIYKSLNYSLLSYPLFILGLTKVMIYGRKINPQSKGLKDISMPIHRPYSPNFYLTSRTLIHLLTAEYNQTLIVICQSLQDKIPTYAERSRKLFVT